MTPYRRARSPLGQRAHTVLALRASWQACNPAGKRSICLPSAPAAEGTDRPSPQACSPPGWAPSGSPGKGRPVCRAGKAARAQDPRTRARAVRKRSSDKEPQGHGAGALLAGCPHWGTLRQTLAVSCLSRASAAKQAPAWPQWPRPPSASTWHVLPVGPHRHLLGDPNSDVHVPPAVQGPQHLVAGAGVDADQGDPGGLEAGRAFPQGRRWAHMIGEGSSRTAQGSPARQERRARGWGDQACPQSAASQG